MADEREELHELRERGHEAGIEGSSKMSEAQLREALAKLGKGESPQEAKDEAKSDKPS
jgi:hypothetical protein